MDKIVIRRGADSDASDFARLAMFTAPEYFSAIFGNRAPLMLEKLFRDERNLFSHTHSFFLEVNGAVAGMTLFYDFEVKNRETGSFVLMLMGHLKLGFFTALPNLLKFGSIFCRIRKGDLYSSNTALYPEFRGRGLGERLFNLAEEKARGSALERIVVDVKSDNEPAINLRMKLGYVVEERLPAIVIGGKKFEYLKLVKYLK